MPDLEELKELAAKCLTPDELLDVLGFDMFDLVDILQESIREFAVEVEAACR